MGFFDQMNRRESDIRLQHLEKSLDNIGDDMHKILISVKSSNNELLDRISDRYATRLSLEKEKNQVNTLVDAKIAACKVDIYKRLASYGSVAVAVFGMLAWVIKTIAFK
jgi:ElaB/YqjD/DUF883 family membrane-anchored ribosome-binding protein